MRLPRWEYLCKEYSVRSLAWMRDEANSLGKEGWELVAVEHDKDARHVYYKRQLAPLELSQEWIAVEKKA